MTFWGWVGAVAAGWFLLSIIVGVAWWLGARRIFRKPPVPPNLSNVESIDRANRKAGA